MATIDEELGQLERDIRQLKIEYDQFFGGGRKRPPTEIEWRIDLLVKRYAERGGERDRSGPPQERRGRACARAEGIPHDLFRAGARDRKSRATVPGIFAGEAAGRRAHRETFTIEL